MIDREKDKKRRAFLFQTKWFPAYREFMKCYPLNVESLIDEIWKDIEGYEGDYQESNYGRTKSFKGKKPRILKPRISKEGYLEVNLCKKGKSKSVRVHILVARSFVSNPENKPEVNHKDGIKFNCHESNLEYMTRSENIRHALNTGLQKLGFKRSNAKLTDEDVRYIREHYKFRDKEFNSIVLAEKFNVNPSIIRDVVQRKRYKNVK